MADNNMIRLYYFLRYLRYRLFEWVWCFLDTGWQRGWRHDLSRSSVGEWVERMAGHGCAHSGCREIGRPCYLDGAYGGRDGEPYIYYCSAHIFKAGFCFSCGQLWAGVENFEFGPGWCSNCASEFEDDDERSEDAIWGNNYDDYEY